MLHSAETKLQKRTQKKQVVPRIYIENRVRLSDANFAPGKTFSIKTQKNKLTIFLAEDGERTVTRRETKQGLKPVVDVTTSDILNAFDKGLIGSQLYARFFVDKIVITLVPRSEAIAERENRLFERLKQNKPLEKVSLFTGSGFLDNAIDRGFESSGIGIKTVFANELEEKFLCNGLENNPSLRGAKSVQGSIAFLHRESLPVSDIMVMGSPCVGLSLAGKSALGISSELEHPDAGHLFIYMLNAILAVNPSVCIIENSPFGIESTTFNLVERVLVDNGYNIQKRLIKARQFGALENRNRMAFVAVSEGIDADINLLLETGEPNITVGDILDDTVDDAVWSKMEHVLRKYERDKKNGRGFKPNIVHANSDKVSVIGKGYVSWRTTEPKLAHPTVDGLYRLFTVSEHCRIKGFDISMLHGLSKTVAHQVLGNGVVAFGFTALAKHIGEQLKMNDTGGQQSLLVA